MSLSIYMVNVGFRCTERDVNNSVAGSAWFLLSNLLRTAHAVNIIILIIITMHNFFIQLFFIRNELTYQIPFEHKASLSDIILLQQ